MSARSSDYPVGYGKPPEHTRFRKGHSGNPWGRPKGSESVARVLRRVLDEKIVVRENGERRRITRLEAVLKQLTNKGMSGDLGAIRALFKLPAMTEQPEQDSPVLNVRINRFSDTVPIADPAWPSGNGQIAGPRPVLSAEPLPDEEWERKYGHRE